MKRKIGDVIEYDGQKFQIMQGTCTDCYFAEAGIFVCVGVVEDLGCCEVEGLVYPIEICYKLVEE